MPYTPTTPTLDLCNDLVTELETAWQPNSPSGVKRGYVHEVVLATVQGRQVVIYPMGYANKPATRGHDWYEHRLMVLTFERYEPAADATEVIPAAWVDERVDFVHTYIIQGLEYGRDGTQPSFNKNVQTLSADVESVCDVDRLASQKMFWCPVELVIRELRSAA